MLSRFPNEFLSFHLEGGLELILIRNKTLSEENCNYILEAAKLHSLHEAEVHLKLFLPKEWWSIKPDSTTIGDKHYSRIRLYGLHLNGKDIPELAAIFLKEK